MTESAVVESLDDRVTSFVAANRGVSPWSLEASSKLQTDLGLDTVSAVGFFESFAAEFGVDIEPLRADWDRHFQTERITAVFGPSIVGIVLLSAFLAVIVHELFPQIPLIGIGIMPLGPVVLFSYFWRKRHPIIPITVAHLLDAARLGRWQHLS